MLLLPLLAVALHAQQQQFMEYVMEQWQLYRLEKEKEKQERVSAKLSVLPPDLEEPLLH